ncbi:MAG: type II CRISPR RNA-guided endonuclease Cas9 [Campylobacterales bacterium]
MVERILGIDLGIASLGWAVVEYDKENDANNKIVDCGVRLFTAAETPKEKESPNKARRDARGIRRVLNRRRVRMNEIKKLFVSARLINEMDLDDDGGMYHGKANRTDVWRLRYEALRRKLTSNELARVLIHIAKHRGYKFIGDEDADDDSGKVKKAGAELRAKFESAGYKTIGEWLWATKGAKGKKRNKSGDYEFSIHRDFLVSEAKIIIETQKGLGLAFANDGLLDAYCEIAFFVKEPPSVEHMVGNCTYFPDEKRAPKCSVTAERFVAIGKLFSTVIVDSEGKEQKIAELKTVDELIDFAVSKEKLDFKALRKFLNLGENQVFKGLHYKGKPKTLKKKEASLLDDNMPIEWEFDKADAEKKVWINLKGHVKFKEALGDRFTDFISNIEIADETAKILTYYKSEKQKSEQLKKMGFDADTIEALSRVSFSDFLMLSLKAIKAILPQMQEGKRYDEAIGILGTPSNTKSEFLPPLKDTDIAVLNPTVIRAFAEFRKVANALVRKYGAFDKVHFELAREVNTKDQIYEIKKGQAKNEKERQEAEKFIKEFFGNQNIPLNRKNILKVQLYKDQDNRCVYSGETIKLERLFDDGYCEIDHILPRSRSADDSYANKVLCFSSANQEKTNRTPFEWFGSDSARWAAFEMRINTQANRVKMGRGKVDRLIKQNFDENSEKEFLSRNLNDTRYMAKAVKTYCEKYWKLTHDDDKLRIQVRSGKLTSELRGRWLEGFMKDRSVHMHHALDAVVIALSTQGMVQKLANYYAAKETRHEKQKPEFKAPMPNFRDAIEKALELEKEENGHKRLLISRPPRAGVTGAAHKETIQSPKEYKGKGLLVNNGKGVCDNGDMPRVDVFSKDGKYYLVPIYVADFAKGELPNKAIVAGKDKEWAAMDESYKFLFSLHKDDLVELRQKNKEPFFGYFLGVHSGTGNISIKKIESQDSFDGLGPKTATYLKKYQIDPLGYYHEVKGEKRLGTMPQEAKRNGVNERRAKKQAEKRAAEGK